MRAVVKYVVVLPLQGGIRSGPTQGETSLGLRASSSTASQGRAEWRRMPSASSLPSQRVIGMKPESVARVVKTTVVLHNFLWWNLTPLVVQVEAQPLQLYCKSWQGLTRIVPSKMPLLSSQLSASQPCVLCPGRTTCNPANLTHTLFCCSPRRLFKPFNHLLLKCFS